MGTIFDREHEPPEPDEADAAYEIAKTVAGVVPGGALVLETVFGSPFARRQHEWKKDIAAAIRDLQEKRGIRPEQLRDNPAFIDAAFAAYQAFVTTSDETKRAALRNAVLNAALPSAPPSADQQVFLSLADRLTPQHLAVLGLFKDPLGWQAPDGRRLSKFRNHTGLRPRRILEEAFPELSGTNTEMADVLWSDLQTNGLVRKTGLDNAGEGEDGVTKPRLTDLGKRFVAFISAP